jgi:hypothetical protein
MPSPYTLLAYNPQKISEQPIQACGLGLNLFLPIPCTYCPSQANATGLCAFQPTETIFAGLALVRDPYNHCSQCQTPGSDNRQDAIVPGGQQVFVDPTTGAIGYTQAHSASMPKDAIQDIEIYRDGAFQVVGTDGWVACPNNGTTYYKLFAKLEGLMFSPSCFPLNLVAQSFQGNGQLAWQYT